MLSWEPFHKMVERKLHLKPDRGQSTAVKWVWLCVNLSLGRKMGGKVGSLLVVVEELEEFPASPFSLHCHFISHLSSFIIYPVKRLTWLVKFETLNVYVNAYTWMAHCNFMPGLFRFYPLIRIYIDFKRFTAWARWSSHIPSRKLFWETKFFNMNLSDFRLENLV